MSELDDVPRRMPKRLWQTTWFWVAGFFATCLTVGAACCLDVPGFLSGETDIFGGYRFEAAQQQARQEMSPTERVHAELFPEWLIAEANRRDTADERFDRLRTAVTDEELSAVLDDLAAAIASERILSPPPPMAADAGTPDASVPAETSPLHIALLRRWNDRLEELAVPFYVTGSISVTSSGPALLCEFYRKLGDPVVKVGDLEIPTVILQRIDRTNIVEAYLGVARSGDVAVVVTDRILELATDSIWLMLNPTTAPQDDLALAYGEAVRDEAVRGLGDVTVVELARAAVHRRKLLDAAAEVLERHSCGSTMQLGFIGWDGFNPRDLHRLDLYAERDKLQPCPTITFAEIDALRDASEALRADSTKDALQALVAWLTRMIALHEARHVADELEHGRLHARESCPGCPDRIHRSTRAELSAYVASIAWSENPATALFQACTVRGGPHGRAVRIINRGLGRRCTDAPPADLSQQARALQQKLFGSAAPMQLPHDFPQQLEIHRWR